MVWLVIFMGPDCRRRRNGSIHVSHILPPSLPPSLTSSLPPSSPHLINPHVPDDNIAVYHEVGDSDGVGCYVLPPELGGHRVLLPEGPVLVLHVHGKHGRMVAHLWVRGEREGGRKSHFCSIHIETSEANTGGCRYTCTLYIQYMYKITLYIHVMEFTLLVCTCTCTCRFPNRCHIIRISAVTSPPLIM